MPLVLMLHGAGSTGRGVSYTFEIADDLGVIVLAPDSRDEATWDMLAPRIRGRCGVHRRGAEGHLRALLGRSQADGASAGTPTARRTRCRSASAPARRSATSWRFHPG